MVDVEKARQSVEVLSVRTDYFARKRFYFSHISRTRVVHLFGNVSKRTVEAVVIDPGKVFQRVRNRLALSVGDKRHQRNTKNRRDPIDVAPFLNRVV